MPYFADAQELYDVMGTFLAEITQQPDMRPKFTSADTSFVVRYHDPEAAILIDCTTDPPRVVNDPPADAAAEINLGMSADDGHRFWCGKLNMALALAKKQVQVSGPMSKMMKLLPAMRPAFSQYEEYLKSRGCEDKLV